MSFFIVIIFLYSILLSNDSYCFSDKILDHSSNLSNREYYNIGDVISETDQNHVYEVCHGDGNYNNGSLFKLADYSGGIILISMNATW